MNIVKTGRIRTKANNKIIVFIITVFLLLSRYHIGIIFYFYFYYCIRFIELLIFLCK